MQGFVVGLSSEQHFLGIRSFIVPSCSHRSLKLAGDIIPTHDIKTRFYWVDFLAIRAMVFSPCYFRTDAWHGEVQGPVREPLRGAFSLCGPRHMALASGLDYQAV